MSTNINANVLKNFIVKTIGADKLTQNQAQKYDIDGNKYGDCDTVLKEDVMKLNDTVNIVAILD